MHHILTCNREIISICIITLYKKAKDLYFPYLFNRTFGWLALFFLKTLVSGLAVNLAIDRVESIVDNIAIGFSR